jgi:antibiotic biosynthesis monooxygenase (ABM) superfamily enzyme
MIVDYTMRLAPHPGYPTDFRRVEHRGQFESWESFHRFKERERQAGWIVENERAADHVPDSRGDDNG